MSVIHLHPCEGPLGSHRRHFHRRHGGALSDLAHQIAATVRQWHRRLREREQLARLDERMLLDIGLSRADAEFLINKPFWKD